MITSASWQVTQADWPSFLNSNYVYVVLISLWSYDYILCLPDVVTYLVESRWGFCTFLHLTTSHLPFVSLIFLLLVGFQLDASIPLCRTYDMINTYVAMLTIACAEGIFVVRTYAVWERERWMAVCAVVGAIVHAVPTIIYMHEFIFLVPEPCWIPGITKYMDAKARSRISVVYSLIIVAELEILLFLLYRTIQSCRTWGIGNRLMASLLRQNLLYCGCGFAFSLSVILTSIFLPFPIAHVLAECQVVVQSIMVTRMHRDFWRSDRLHASHGISTDASFSMWMERTLDIV